MGFLKRKTIIARSNTSANYHTLADEQNMLRLMLSCTPSTPLEHWYPNSSLGNVIWVSGYVIFFFNWMRERVSGYVIDLPFFAIDFQVRSSTISMCQSRGLTRYLWGLCLLHCLLPQYSTFFNFLVPNVLSFAGCNP